MLENGKKLWNIKVTVIPIVNGAVGTVTKRLVSGTGGFGNRTREDIQNNSIVKIGHNTEKNRGDLRRLEETWNSPQRNGTIFTNPYIRAGYDTRSIL